MNSEYGPVEVQIIGGLQMEDEILKKCQVTFLGEPPNATVRLYQWQRGEMRFRAIDTITEATVASTSDTEFRVSGISEQLVDEVGMAREDASVTWVVNISRCPSC